MGHAIEEWELPIDCDRNWVLDLVQEKEERESDMGVVSITRIEWIEWKEFGSKSEAFRWLDNRAQQKAHGYWPCAARFREGTREGWALHFEFHV